MANRERRNVMTDEEYKNMSVKEFTKAAGQAAAPPAGGLGCSCGLRFPIQQFQCVVVTMDIIQHAIKHGLFVAI